MLIWHHCPSLYGSVQTRDCRCIKGWNKLYLSSHWLKPWIPRHIPNTFPNPTSHVQRIFYMRFGFDNLENKFSNFFVKSYKILYGIVAHIVHWTLHWRLTTLTSASGKGAAMQILSKSLFTVQGEVRYKCFCHFSIRSKNVIFVKRSNKYRVHTLKTCRRMLCNV